MKDIIWEGSSLKDLNGFSLNARRRAGYELFSVQKGEEPSDWKPMKGIGPGVKEIRIHIKTSVLSYFEFISAYLTQFLR